jgi:hypothetical protein
MESSSRGTEAEGTKKMLSIPYGSDSTQHFPNILYPLEGPLKGTQKQFSNRHNFKNVKSIKLNGFSS